MTVNSWQPTPSTEPFIIDPDQLQRFIALSAEEKLDQLNQHLDEDTIRNQAPLMTLGQSTWMSAAEELDNHQLIHLVRFFTVAEQQLSGWEAQEQSPVIWLVKVLRRRKAPPEKSLLMWIKQHSDNRFLPNGAL